MLFKHHASFRLVRHGLEDLRVIELLGDATVIHGKGLPIILGREEQTPGLREGGRVHRIPPVNVALEASLVIGTDPAEHGQVQIDDLIVYRLSFDFTHDLVHYFQGILGLQRIPLCFIQGILQTSKGMHL